MNIKNKITATFLDRKDALPSGQVQDIIQDSNNIFWFAGPNGLAKYDGVKIRAFHQKDGLSTHGLRSVNASNDGRIWIGSDVGVDIIETDGRIQRLVGVGEWKYGFVECIAISEDDTVWLGTSEGLLKWNKTKGLQPIEIPSLNSRLITSLHISKSGVIWVGSAKSGLLKYESEKWISPSMDWKKIGSVLTIAGSDPQEGENETIFLGGEKGLVQIDSDGRAVGHLNSDNTESVTAILNVGDELWLGIGGQLRVYQRSESSTWQVDQVILENVFVNKLFFDSIGNIWGATDSYGVFKISALRKAIIQPILPKSKAIFAISRVSPEQFLLGGDQCSWKIGLNEDKLIAEKIEDLSGIKIWDLIEHKQKTILAATEIGLQRVSEHKGSAKRIGTGDKILSSPGRVLIERRESSWIGTVSGLVELKEDHVKHITDSQDCSLGYVYTLAEDSEKNIWIGTLGNGLWRETRNGVEKIESRQIKPYGNIYAIEFSSDGENVAVIQDNKIIIMDPAGKTINVIDTEDSVAGWSALWMGKSIWVGSSSGLHEYEVESGREIRRITALKGVANWEFTTSRSLEADQMGRLLCGLNGGLTIVDLDKLAGFNETPPVKIDRVNWSNAIIEEDNNNNGGVIVAPGKWTLDVEAYVGSFIDEGDTWVRFRLVGFDKSWQAYKKNARIQYNSLPPGKYSLEAQAYVPLIGVGKVTKLFDLQVRQPWWSKGWFALPYAASEAVLGLIEARWRNRHLLERNQRLEERVEERTREIDEANKALQKLNQELQLVSATDPLTGVANRRQFDEVFERELERGRRAESDLTLVMMDIDYFKAYNDTYGHIRGDECLQLVADTMVKSFRSGGGDFVARYGGEEFVAILPDTDLNGALVITGRIRKLIENLKIPHEGSSVSDFVTLSLGVASIKLDLTLPPEKLIKIKENLIATADKVLYEAKNAGRNRIISEKID